jgi:hypothetical protein
MGAMIFGRESSPTALCHGGSGWRDSRAAARNASSKVSADGSKSIPQGGQVVCALGLDSSVVDDLRASVVSWSQQ